MAVCSLAQKISEYLIDHKGMYTALKIVNQRNLFKYGVRNMWNNIT